MKLISLNIWGGKKFKPLINFIKENSKDTDIFCFQEVFDTSSNIKKSSGYRTNIYQELIDILTSHQGYFAPVQDNYLVGSFQKHFTNFSLLSGLAIFIRKNLTVKLHGDFLVYGKKNGLNPHDRSSVPKNVQFLLFENSSKIISLSNVHGLWTDDKKDSPARISQSKKIVHFLNKPTGEKIVCGDFNLDINTESLRLLEANMINLIKEYKIRTTRSKLYSGKNKFADYILVAPEIKVINFEVPSINVSDHLPMVLEFS